MPSPTPTSLYVDEQVSFQDVFPLLILLRRIVGLIIFPPEGDAALDTIYISHRVVSSRHLAIARFAFDDVHHSLKEICPAVLAVESPRKHRMDSGQMRLAGGTSIDSGSGQVLTIAHTHCGAVLRMETVGDLRR